MSKILDCTNLLGDSLYLLKPVQLYMQTYPSDVLCLVTDRGLPYELFVNTFPSIPVFTSDAEAQESFPSAMLLRLNAGYAGELAFANAREKGKQLHISEAYAKMLGIDLLDDIEPPSDWQRVPEHDRLKPFIGIAPFSRSCSVHTTGKANKTLADWKWEHIIRYLRKRGLPVKVFGAPVDYLQRCSVPLDDYIVAKNLYELERALRSCVLFVTLDNGLCHLAGSLHIPEILLWPVISNADFIAPRFNPNSQFLIMDPNAAAPMAILHPLRKAVKFMLEGTSNEALQET